MSKHPFYMLGKAPAKADPKVAAFESFVRAKVTVPDEYDWDVVHGRIPMPMFANDRLGCCVISGRAHQTLRFEYLEQKQVISISDKDVSNEYFKESGGRDSGLVVTQSLRAWRAGWKAAGKTYSIKGYATTQLQNHQSIKEAIYLDTGVGIGVSLPISAQKQIDRGQIWDVSRIGGRPGSWGGHYVFIVGYTKDGPVCVTWGRKQAMTWAFWDKYCDESYAIFDALNTAKAKKALDVKAVKAYMASMPTAKKAGNKK
jgi:hypothetical protein